MTTTKKIHEITLSLYELVSSPFPKDDREVFIEKINELLNIREIAIKKLPEIMTDEDKMLGNEIITYNIKISKMLSGKINIIKSDIKVTRHKKETGEMYDNPYEASIDGMFFDKKK